jgi:hypothetical protein
MNLFKRMLLYPQTKARRWRNTCWVLYLKIPAFGLEAAHNALDLTKYPRIALTGASLFNAKSGSYGFGTRSGSDWENARSKVRPGIIPGSCSPGS